MNTFSKQASEPDIKIVVVDEFGFSMSRWIVLKPATSMYLFFTHYFLLFTFTSTLTHSSWCNSVIESALQSEFSNLHFYSAPDGGWQFVHEFYFWFMATVHLDVTVSLICICVVSAGYVCWVIQAKRAEQRKHINTHLTSAHTPPMNCDRQASHGPSCYRTKYVFCGIHEAQNRGKITPESRCEPVIVWC